MAKNRDVFDALAVTLFVIGGISNFLLGVLFLLYLSLLAALYFAVGLVCWWVAWGIWSRHWQLWRIGFLLSLINFLPLDQGSQGAPVPNLTNWILIFVPNYGTAWTLSALIGIAGVVYFVTRRGRFEIGVRVAVAN